MATNLNKVEICERDNKYYLRIVLKDPVYGYIRLYSDRGSLHEMDCRAIAVARILGLERDNLPVH
ncbi:MAG: hypothetical protein JSW11_00845 [Candidatus Heimdallarchaeota archaeon]|nr:MAG: hypothetical protein JSW11_00845 [Candidatus Heimdallarchaeota archaeon]